MSSTAPVAAAFAPDPTDRQPRATLLERVERLARSPRPEASWWVELVNGLEHLEDRLAEHRGRALTTRLREQLAWDAPHLAGRATALDRELDSVAANLQAARALVGERAGDQAAVREVSAVASDAVHGLRRWERRSSDLLHAAYQVDMGGESAA